MKRLWLWLALATSGLACDEARPSREHGKSAALPLAAGESDIVHRGPRVTVRMPLRADGPMFLADRASGVSAEVRLLDAPEAVAEVIGDAIRYRGGKEPDVSVRVHDDGFEDFLSYARKPAKERARYRLTPEAAGMRFVAGTLELLDAGGAPRLRMSPPYLVDADGVMRTVPVTIEGCAPDRDPRPPWGRGVTPAQECLLTLDWSSLAARYPVVVDPQWSFAGVLSQARGAPLARLGALVLAAGGRGEFVPYATCDLYDETTGTWAVTEPLPEARHAHSLSALGGRAVVAGGCALHEPGVGQACSPQPTVWRYDPNVTTGSLWTSLSDLTTPRARHAAVALDAHRIIVAGGHDSDDLSPLGVLATAEIYDDRSGSWAPAASMQGRRLSFGAAVSENGRIAVAGGYSHYDIVDQSFLAFELATAELYDPSNDEWSLLPAMNQERGRPTLSALPGQRLLVVGGIDGATQLASAEVLDLSNSGGSWQYTKSLAAPRLGHFTQLLENGWVIVGGGFFTSSVEAYPAEGSGDAAWTAIDPLPENRHGGGRALLPSGALLLAGGFGNGQSAIATTRLFSPTEAGTPCGLGATCASGHCVDGVCCESACDDACSTCAAALGSSADGSCGEATSGAPDPRGLCADQGGCGTTGLCASGGTCAFAPEGALCEGCAVSDAGRCDGRGDCACGTSGCVDPFTHRDAAGVETACAPYACTAGGCADSCASATECASGYVCDRDRRCVWPTLVPSDGGCSCAVAAVSAQPAWGFIAACFAMMAFGIRRLWQREER